MNRLNSDSEVEHAGLTALQFSPTVSPQLRMSVCVSTSQLSYFLSHDFANFWSEVRGQNSKTPDTAGFLIKIFLNDPIKKNCFFDHSVNFLVNFLSKDFVQTLRKENLEG